MEVLFFSACDNRAAMEILPVVARKKLFFLSKAISHQTSVKVYKCNMIGNFEA
jgi:hypothetical protein